MDVEASSPEEAVEVARRTIKTTYGVYLGDHFVKIVDVSEAVSLADLVDRLGNYVAEDAREAYDKLVIAAEIDGTQPADDVVTIWEPLEGRFTVDELLGIIE